MKCDHCLAEIILGDNYIKDGEQRFCSDCYEEDTITNYYVGGEYQGDDNNIEAYDDWDFEEVQK